MTPWLTIIGIGEDGYGGLGANARAALDHATMVFGGRRHLEFLPETLGAKRIA
ncbi:TPA: cobalamin biosynthesis bifunctional protein CbiET, partial [Escherichia coli]|nr:cobalamin biosynthesis bifunctional protein CbiET [Escherichia coli]